MQSLRENDYLIQHHQAKRNRWFVFGLVGVLLVVCLCGVTGSVTYALLWRNKVEKYELTFAIVGDFGRGNLYQKQVAQQMGDACQKAVPQCSFIISAGDNFYDYGVKNLQDPLWKAYFEDIYTHPALQKRWFVTLGNHDYLGNVQAQIDYTNISSRWYLPSRYYFHKEALKNIVVDFTFVDTNPFVGMDASKGQFNDSVQNVTQQLQWIREKLSKASNEHSEYDEEQSHWRIVVGHHPLFSAGSHGDTPQLIQQLQPVLDQYKVHTYFSGHDHDLQHIQARNMTQKRVGSEEINPHFVDYFVSGGGSTPNTTDAREGHSYRIKEYYAGSGFMLVRISKLEMVIDFVDTNGSVIYTHVKKHRKGLQESAAVFN